MAKIKITITDSNCRNAISKKDKHLSLKIYVRQYAMNYGTVCTHLFMQFKMEQS